MENQYTYYTPDNHYGEQEPKPRRQHKVPKWVKFLCMALIFGLVAGASFQGGSFVVGKVLDKVAGREEKSGPEGKQVEGTQLKTSSGGKITTDVTEIAQNAMPSVVSITNISIQQVQSFFGGVYEREIPSAGSGIIVGQNDEELLILTNNHVVDSSETLTVSFIDEESAEAAIKGTDPAKDLAVVAVKLKDIKKETMDQIKVATLGDSTELQVGEPAIAIGNALGYGQSVTTGIVSATQRVLEGFDSELIQTDAAINPGNSGGALLNANGEVIGINTMKASSGGSEVGVEGMGYAIPVSDASDVITVLMNKETRTKLPEGQQGYLGIQPTEVGDEVAQMYNMPTGVYISEVVKGGAAEKAGLSKGSIITKIEGISIDSVATLRNQLQYYSPGENISVTVQIPSKNGEYEEETVEVVLGTNS